MKHVSRRRDAKRIFRAVFESLEGRTLLANSVWAFPDASGRLIYGTQADGDRIPDFSMVGYKNGSVALPNTSGGASVPVKATVNPGAAGVDMTSTIQQAINNVSGLTPDANGFKGAVLLTAGNYPISGTLNINSSGVVLMGVGDSSTTGTRLEATGTATRFLIEVDGSGSRSTSGSTYTISDSYVPVGATSFHVTSTSSLAVGDSILITRPSPQNWIDDIGMNLLDMPWTPGSKNINWERTVTAIDTVTKTVTIDIPLTNSLDAQYGGGTFKHYSYSGRINQVGVSDMYMYSDSTGAGDLAHATGSIDMDRTINGWVHNVTSDGFAVNQIVFSGGTKFCTIDDAVIQNTTVSSQAPPAGLSFNGQMCLANNIVYHGVYHAFAVGATVPGPMVFMNMTADGLLSESGPHQRWSTGGLIENFSVPTEDIQVTNRGNSGSGHGWAGANWVTWNSTAKTLDIASPPTAQNWVIGSKGTQKGAAIYDSYGTPVSLSSLYSKQLWDRTHVNPTVATNAAANPNPLNGATSITLSVLGADASVGEAGLTYAWVCTSKPNGAGTPTFSGNTNGTNAAKNITATLSQPGTYIFTVTLSDAGGLKTTSTVIVTPAPATVINGDQDFANENDTIRIVRNGSFIDVYRNSASPFIHQDYATAPQFVISALGGNDTVIVDYSGGNPVPAQGLVVDGGSGTDVVSVVGSGGDDTLALSGASATLNGGQFAYSGAEELDLALGAGADSLTVAGNAGVNATAMKLDLSGGGSLSMAASSTLPDFVDLTVGAGTTFNLNGQNQTVDALNGSGAITNNGAAAATLTVGQYNSGGAFSGTLANGSSTLALTKNGAGTLTLSGNNTYSGNTMINAGVLESGNSASLVGLSGPIWFNGGTLHVTANSVAANVANKFATAFPGATSSSTATIDVDAGVTLTVGGSAGASMRTAGNGTGGAFTKTGAGTLLVLSNNNQLDVAFKLNQGAVILQSATGLGGADSSANHVDMKNGTTLVLRQDTSTNFLTPIVADPGAAISVVIDRITPGAAPTHSLNAISSSGAFTLNLSAGSNVTGGSPGFSLGAATLGGDSIFNVASTSAVLTVSGVVSGAFGVTKTGAGTLLFGGADTYTGATNINAGTFRVNGSIAPSSGVTVALGASFIAGATQTLASLTINSGGNALILAGGSRVLRTSALSIVGSGKLDLADNDLIIDYSAASPLGAISGWIATGFAAGAWNGQGINSSTAATNPSGGYALGYSEASDLGITAFSGQSVDATAVLVKFTYAGDFNLDGQVDVADLGRLATGWQTSQRWIGGDTTYDGFVDVADLGALATNWQRGVGAPLSPAAQATKTATAVAAEPTSQSMKKRATSADVVEMLQL